MVVYVVIHKSFFNGFVETTIIHISADKRIAETYVKTSNAWESYEVEEHNVSGISHHEL